MASSTAAAAAAAAAYTSHLHHAQIGPHDDQDHGGGTTDNTTPFSTQLFRLSSSSFRRIPSFSPSSPSFSSNSSSNGSFYSFTDDSPTPFSPSRTPFRRFPTGVPFSWEQTPGKPKKNEAPKKEELSSNTLSTTLLPLPPPAGGISCSSNINSSSSSSSFRKTSKEAAGLMDNMISESFREDPFFAALVECSKDDLHHHLHNRRGDVIQKYWKGSKVSPGKSTLSDRLGFINIYASCKRTCAVSESIVFVPRSSRQYNLINRR